MDTGKMSGATNEDSTSMAEVLVVSDNCCNPDTAPAEERAVQTVDNAIATTGVAARAQLVSATDALNGALSPDVLSEIQTRLQEGTAQPPMVLIEDKVMVSGEFTQGAVEEVLAATYSGEV